MATAIQIARLREYIAEPTSVDPYTDAQLSLIIDQEGTPEAAAYRVWTAKGAKTSTLVDVSEGGSSRKLGSLAAQAFSMAERFRPWVTTPADQVVTVTGPTVGDIVRD